MRTFKNYVNMNGSMLDSELGYLSMARWAKKCKLNKSKRKFGKGNTHQPGFIIIVNLGLIAGVIKLFELIIFQEAL